MVVMRLVCDGESSKGSCIFLVCLHVNANHASAREFQEIARINQCAACEFGACECQS